MACTQGVLQITNKTSSEIESWIQIFNPALTQETEIGLPAQKKISYEISQTDPTERFSLLHYADSKAVDVSFECQNKVFRANTLEGGQQVFKKSDLQENQIWLQNLFSASNKFQIEFLNKYFKILKSKTLNLDSIQQYNLKINEKNWTYLRISAENRFTAFNMSSTGSENPIWTRVQKSSPDPSAHYFLVGPRARTDESFIVQIRDPQMVKRAQDLVAHPEIEKMLFGRVQKGAGQFNRNWSKAEKSFWSWSVSEVTNFAEIGSTACNGNPQLLEDHVGEWISQSGRICFWDYRIKKELTPEQVAGLVMGSDF